MQKSSMSNMTYIGAVPDPVTRDNLAEIPVVAKKRSDIRAAIKQDYQCPTDLSRPQRSAHFFAWCTKNYPGIFIAWAYVYMAINSYSKALASNAREVQSLRNSAGTIRKALKARYNLCLIPGSDCSARATHDDTDWARTALTRKTIDYHRAKQRLVEVYEMGDPSRIKDPKLREWASKSLREIVKTISAPGWDKKLLPPAPKSDE